MIMKTFGPVCSFTVLSSRQTRQAALDSSNKSIAVTFSLVSVHMSGSFNKKNHGIKCMPDSISSTTCFHLASSSQILLLSLFVVRERKINKFGGISRLGHTVVDVLHKSQSFFVTVNQRQGVLHWNDSQKLKTPT